MVIDTYGEINYFDLLHFQDGNAVALRYKDIISNFENVLQHVARKQENKGQTQFPITLGINAFRGFLDEFMHQYKPSDKKVRAVQ